MGVDEDGEDDDGDGDGRPGAHNVSLLLMSYDQKSLQMIRKLAAPLSNHH